MAILIFSIILLVAGLAMSFIIILKYAGKEVPRGQILKDGTWVDCSSYEYKSASGDQRRVVNTREGSYPIRWLSLLAGPLLAGIVLLAGMVAVIDSREVAVVTRFGEVVDVVNTPGFKVKSPLDSYHIFDKSVQYIVVEREVYTSDLQSVTVSFNIEYQIKPDEVKDLFLKYRTLKNVELYLTNSVLQETESAAKNYTARELTTKKLEYVATVKSQLLDSFAPYSVNVQNIRLTNTVYSAVFENLLEQTLLAEQEIIRQRAELEKKLQAAEYAVQVAEQKALEDLAKAQGEANAVIAKAEAQANAITLVAQANAEAYAAKIREIAAQLGIDTDTATVEQTNALLSYIKYLEYLAAWDGELPQFITDGSGIIIQP